jgi:hypothetical protein
MLIEDFRLRSSHDFREFGISETGHHLSNENLYSARWSRWIPMKYTYFPVARLAISYSTMEFNGQFGRDDCIIAEPNTLLKTSHAESENIFC